MAARKTTRKPKPEPKAIEINVHKDMMAHIRTMQADMATMRQNEAVAAYIQAVNDYNSFVVQVARICNVDVDSGEWQLDIAKGKWVKRD